MNLLRIALVVGASLLLADTAHAQQARLIVQNQSQREMTTKLMRIDASEDVLHATTSVAPNGMQTIYFSESGNYFLKTMAVLPGRDPIFQKGSSFQVLVGPRGYSVLTMTFTIVESAVPQVQGGRQISQREFDQDRSQR
jgi:hypothetical protein